MSLTIRAAKESDLDVLVALNAQVQALHVQLAPSDFRADGDPDEVAAFWRGVLDRDGHHALLALRGELPVGYAWFELQERATTPFSPPRRRVYLHHIGVDAASRRQGVARSLLAHVEAWAQERGLAKVALDCWAANQGAQALFRACGYAPTTLVLDKSL